MLFEREELRSKYDFDGDILEIGNDMGSLCKEILRVTDAIHDSYDKGEEIAFCHRDNRGREILIPECVFQEGKVFERSLKDIDQLLNRADSHSSIAKHLQKMGLEVPDKDSQDYKRYLQLLYFFYMVL